MSVRRWLGGRGRVEAPLFAALWLAFGFFHAGGGWNQNARFAQVRSIVEQRRATIDDYLVYAAARPEGTGFRFDRAAIVGGELEIEGARYALTWTGGPGAAFVVAGDHSDARPVPIEAVAVSGDVAVTGAGRLVPNKAPGTVWLAVPAYAAVRAVAAVAGADPDSWWNLTLAFWLTSALSIAPLTALGGVVVHRLALSLAPGDDRAALGAALTWGLGTLTWSYGSMLYEHGPAAVGLAAAVLLLSRLDGRGARRSSGAARAVAAGAAAGGAIATSYLAAPLAPLLAWLALRRAGGRALAGFAAGLAVPCLAVALYHQACFGSPWATAYGFQNPQFLESDGAWLGVVERPSAARLAMLLLSPFRGLFASSPVLLLGVVALAMLALRREDRPRILPFVAVVVFFLLFAASFNGWHGGWAVGPRYVVPALPFLAAPLVVAFRRWPRLTTTLAVVSILVQGLVVAVDPQPAVGVSSIASRPGVARWRQSPIGDYIVPVFLAGRPQGLLDALGERSTPLSGFRGPVSANPMGAYEGWPGRLFPLASTQARWNSFNAGEWVAPQSRWSLAPLLAGLAGLVALALRGAGARPGSAVEGA